MTDLLIGGLSRWLPLDLEADTDEYAARLVQEYPRSTNIELVASGVAGMAARFRQFQLESEEHGESVLVAAWLFLRADDDLSPLAHATLQGLALPPGDDSVRTAVDRLLQEEDEIYQEPETRDLVTESGPATFVRYRPVHHVGAERHVHERSMVLWMRPDQGMVAVLDAYTDDLLAGQEVPEALARLAEGVSGL